MKIEKINKFCEIILDNSWTSYDLHGVKGYFKGYLYKPFYEKRDAAEYLIKKFIKEDTKSITKKLNSIRGHYAFILEKEDKVIACVDVARSIPLSYLLHNRNIYLFSPNNEIIDKIGFDVKEIDTSAAISIGMSGCTIGRDTLFKEMKNLNAGEFISIEKNNINNFNWFTYIPDLDFDKSKKNYLPELNTVLNGIFDNIIKSCNGKKILIPLSAGLDSRLVASFLSLKKYKNVYCFSYGQKGNFEAYHAKKISKKLGYKWFFIEINYKIARNFYKSETYKKYLSYSDSFASNPVSHELIACDYLKRNGFDKDCIIINGMPGDFFTGGHIPIKLINPSKNINDLDKRKNFIIDCYIEKHFSLWEMLKTKKNISLVKNKLLGELSQFDMKNYDKKNDYIYYEYLEFLNRQTKLIMSNQRVYDFFGFDWRLPFFDYEFIELWRNVGITEKQSQSLFSEYLDQRNIGEVWRPLRKKTWVSPRFHRYTRIIFKALFYTFYDKFKWHKFNKKYFDYFNDVSKKNAIVSWRESIKDKRGWRNANSWLVEKYLNKFKIKIDELTND